MSDKTDLTADEAADELIKHQRRKALRRTTLGAVAFVMIVGLSVATTLAIQWATGAEEKQEQAETGAQVAEAEADFAKDSLRTLCARGVKSACRAAARVSEVVDDPDPDDGDPDDPEVDDPDPDDPERQERERQQPEKQNPEGQDGEVDDAEDQDDEIQDDEIQDDEIDNPEPDDPEPNDPQDPADTITLANFPLPGQTTVCTRDNASDPQNPTYSCAIA